MQTFPDNFKPECIQDFKEILFQKNLGLLREEIYNLVLRGNENDFFDLVIFNKKVGDMKSTMEMCNVVIEELNIFCN